MVVVVARTLFDKLRRFSVTPSIPGCEPCRPFWLVVSFQTKSPIDPVQAEIYPKSIVSSVLLLVLKVTVAGCELLSLAVVLPVTLLRVGPVYCGGTDKRSEERRVGKEC